MKNIIEEEIKVCEIRTGSKGSGYFSKELINKMLVNFKRAGHTLTDLYISQKDMEDVTEWTDSDLGAEEKNEVFDNPNIWSLNLHKIENVDTGFSGKSTVLGFDFKNSKLSETQKSFHAETYFSGTNSDSEVFGLGIINRLNK